jgi:gamma-glutamylputrescine oxidase
MVNQNCWITTLLVKEHKYCPPLTKAIKCDVLIVGGGFSGVSAAAEFLRKGLSVVLIEKNTVGGSSSGRSAGFLTPDSELELHQLVCRYGASSRRDLGRPRSGHYPPRRQHPGARYPVRIADPGFIVPRARNGQGGGR